MMGDAGWNLARARETLHNALAAPGGRRLALVGALAALAWIAGIAFLLMGSDLAERVQVQAARFSSLSAVSRAYLALPPSQLGTAAARQAADPLALASETIEKLRLKDRLKTLSTSGQGVSLSLEGLGRREALDLARELDRSRLAVISAEIRALPSGGKRLLSVNLLLGARP